jgi:hypothetical protein
MNKELCLQFFKHAPIMSDILKEGNPYWNGEDIFMSAVARDYYGNDNFVAGWDDNRYESLQEVQSGICHWKGTIEYRTLVLRFCKDYFGIWDEWWERK